VSAGPAPAAAGSTVWRDDGEHDANRPPSPPPPSATGQRVSQADNDLAAPPLSAAILAGGQSRRMGVDKALLRLVPGGPTLIEQVAAAVGAVAGETLIVANDRRCAFLNLPIVHDRYPGAGALGGIYSAVAAAAHDHCLVVACDMPFLSAPLLRALAAQPRDYDVLAPFLPVAESRQGTTGGVYETLHALYGRGALAAMREQLEAGRYKIVGFFPRVRVRPFPVEEVRRHDPTLRSFFNVNTPERLTEARRLVMREG
jgi:molybdopterin-guanine dinucleotide biosynthesis protein A